MTCSRCRQYDKIIGMNPYSQDTYTQAYNKWVTDPSPDNMAGLVSAFAPTINSELQQYSGSRELLRSRAKAFVIDAIRSFNPEGRTNLNTWVVTNLKQLSRYGKSLRTVHTSEDIARNVAEYRRSIAELEDSLGREPTDEELQDHTGWSMKTLAKIKDASVQTVNSQTVTNNEGENGPEDPETMHIDNVPYAADAVYASLGDRDRDIYDYKLGAHGREQLSGKELAARLGVTPAYISQRANDIGSIMSTMGNM